jgi:hypothetical protein
MEKGIMIFKDSLGETSSLRGEEGEGRILRGGGTYDLQESPGVNSNLRREDKEET